MRLGDLDALYERLKHFGLENGSSLGRHSGLAEEFLDAIKYAPTIDPESLRPEGIWVKTCVPDIYACTHCKKATKMDELCNSEILRPFCPNCGARMKGGI